MSRCSLIVLVLSWLFAGAVPAEDAGFAAQRAALVDEVRSYGRREPPPGKDGLDERVLAALAEVERHRFVPERLQSEAYADHPLPIGHGQTISQPFIVALMTDLVAPGPDDVVLEVGTGSGYQAAVLAKLVRQVYSIEIIEPLASSSRARLERLGYANVPAG